MSAHYNLYGYPVKVNDISSINLTSCYFLNSYDDKNGGGVWTFKTLAVGCGSTGFNLIINDSDIPFAWTKISWNMRTTTKSSCWNFSNGTSYGAGAHNLSNYSEANGDRVSSMVNAFNLSQFSSPKMGACDNNSDNFMHGTYAVGDKRGFASYRRRSGTASAGVGIGFACISVAGETTISDIRVYP